MENIDRRKVLGMMAAWPAGGLLCPRLAYGNELEKVNKKTPMLHVTDLFRPHMDPDDHWDLACVYALAYRGDIDLKGIKREIVLKRPVNVGIVGWGVIAETHLSILKKIRSANVAALCDLNRTSAEKLGRKFGLDKIYTDYDEMLSGEKG